MLSLIMWIVLILAAMVIILIGSFAGKMQAVTLWVGKRIAPAGMDDELKTGFQDAITPKIQDFFNTILPISYIVIIIAGAIITWYLGVLALIVAFILMILVNSLWPNDIKFYLKIITHYMDNRIADYARDGDHMRSDAAKEMSQKLHMLYQEIKGKKLVVPKLAEVKAMPLGNE